MPCLVGHPGEGLAAVLAAEVVPFVEVHHARVADELAPGSQGLAANFTHELPAFLVRALLDFSDPIRSRTTVQERRRYQIFGFFQLRGDCTCRLRLVTICQFSGTPAGSDSSLSGWRGGTSAHSGCTVMFHFLWRSWLGNKQYTSWGGEGMTYS